MRYLKYIAGLVPVCFLSSCLIENDMSYPRVYGNITSFEVAGQVKSEINTTDRTVLIELGETSDISALEITAFSLSEGARCDDPSIEVGSHIDLSTPKTLIISTYQDYEWIISANMPIDRYVRCENQADDAVFNLENNTVTLNVTQLQDLSSVTVTEMKLGIDGSVIYLVNGDGTEMECTFPMVLDCSSPRTFRVEANGVSTTWTLTVSSRNVVPAITGVNPWCYHADITAEFVTEGTEMPELQYRPVTGGEWISVPSSEYVIDGIDLSASVTGLEAGTSYSVRLVLGDTEGQAVDFNTGSPVQIENMNFDSWYYTGSESRPVWYPNLNESIEVWGTANPGSGTFIGSLTTRTDEVCDEGRGEGKYAARLESKNAIIAFAAGNIFTGQFGHLVGLSGAELYWGTPFTARPRSLKGYYAYKPAPIDYVRAPYENLENSMDKCQILVILTDWDGQFTINTTEGLFVDQDNDSHIIAYAKYESDMDTWSSVNPAPDSNGYIPFELELEYRRPDATPKYAVVVACSSYLGDYFTGGTGSTMYVDEFEFVYD